MDGSIEQMERGSLASFGSGNTTDSDNKVAQFSSHLWNGAAFLCVDCATSSFELEPKSINGASFHVHLTKISIFSNLAYYKC